MASNKAAQRIIRKDITSVDNDDMKSNGIYYFADHSNVMKGLGLVIGPPQTPYEGGFWFFSVKFHDQHPFEPPEVLSLTQDGRTRFNPNMYREGKVCLSLLGTWHQGDKWSSVQTLGSVLLSILGMVLTEEPLRNEPCYSTLATHPNFAPYNRMVFHASVETILRFIETPPLFLPEDHKDAIIKIMKQTFLKTADSLASQCRGLSASGYDGIKEENDLFKMSVKYIWKTLADKIQLKKTAVAASLTIDSVTESMEDMDV
jgi:ubiquitin-conjugating enzyme E2 Z